MKKAVLVACACIMFLSVILTGCELLEEEKDYVIVTVTAKAFLSAYSAEGEMLEYHFAGNILIDITKSGGEGVHELRKISANQDFTDPVTTTFNVYREQRIEIVGTVQGYDPDLTIKTLYGVGSGRAVRIINWEEIFEQAGGFGESAAFDTTLPLAWIEP